MFTCERLSSTCREQLRRHDALLDMLVQNVSVPGERIILAARCHIDPHLSHLLLSLQSLYMWEQLGPGGVFLFLRLRFALWGFCFTPKQIQNLNMLNCLLPQTKQIVSDQTMILNRHRSPPHFYFPSCLVSQKAPYNVIETLTLPTDYKWT